ncbi:MAG: hypothetical protein ACREDH_15595 [Methylocella sp.]
MNSPAPLVLSKTLLPAPLRPGGDVIAETWARLASRIEDMNPHDNRLVDLMREGFVAGLYSASAAISMQRADARTISEAAFRVEQGR